jgi:hypothetical protein
VAASLAQLLAKDDHLVGVVPPSVELDDGNLSIVFQGCYAAIEKDERGAGRWPGADLIACLQLYARQRWLPDSTAIGPDFYWAFQLI